MLRGVELTGFMYPAARPFSRNQCMRPMQRAVLPEYLSVDAT